MRKILLTVLLIPSIVFAQVQGEPIGAGSNLQGLACRVNESQTDLADTEADANFCAADKKGNLLVSLRSGTASATNPIKLEDSAHTSGDAGIQNLGVVNNNQTALAANGDYAPHALNTLGAAYVELDSRYRSNQVNNILKVEDTATAADEAIVGIGVKVGSALSVDASNGDWGILKGDLSGRLVTTDAPAEETWQSCSSSNTGTSDVAIKAAVASNRIYVTSIGCTNSADVQSQMLFKDGSTTMWAGSMEKSSLMDDGYHHTFKTPLRGSVNTALNFAMVTNLTSTVCCANGYISTN